MIDAQIIYDIAIGRQSGRLVNMWVDIWAKGIYIHIHVVEYYS